MGVLNPTPSPPGGAPAPPGPHELLGNLLDRLAELIGPDAALATMQYASQQEGLRLVEAHGIRDLPAGLRLLDQVLGQTSRVVERPDRIEVPMQGPLPSGNPLRQIVVLGLIEGMLRKVRGRAYWGKVVPGTGAETIAEFRLEKT